MSAPVLYNDLFPVGADIGQLHKCDGVWCITVHAMAKPAKHQVSFVTRPLAAFAGQLAEVRGTEDLTLAAYNYGGGTQDEEWRFVSNLRAFQRTVSEAHESALWQAPAELGELAEKTYTDGRFLEWRGLVQRGFRPGMLAQGIEDRRWRLIDEQSLWVNEDGKVRIATYGNSLSVLSDELTESNPFTRRSRRPTTTASLIKNYFPQVGGATTEPA